MQDIEDFKCILCKESFIPPYALPYLLPCTHSLCTRCLQAAISHHQTHIICPEDLQSNSLSEIRTDTSSRRALERLVREHKNYNQNNQLLCIQSLSKHFQVALEQQEQQRKDFLQLIDQIFRSEMQRLAMLQQRIHQELDSPLKVVKEWKENLKSYLETLKSFPRSTQASQIHSQLAYYIDQGRRIKQQLNQFHNLDYQDMANALIVCPTACLSSDFTIKEWANSSKTVKTSSLSKASKSAKQPKVEENKVQTNTTHQSTKKKQNDFLSLLKDNGPSKRFCSQPMEIKKLVTLNNEDHSLNQLTNCFYKDISRERNSAMNDVPTHRDTSELKEEVLQELQLNCGSRDVSSSYGKNPLIYSPDENSLNRLHSPIIEYDELLLTQKQQKKWVMGNYNFMQECQIDNSCVSQSIQIKKKQPFNWQKQSNNYVKRMSLLRVEQAYKNTLIATNTIELINYPLQDVEITLLLTRFDWTKLEVVKLVRTNIVDSQLNDLLNFTVNSSVSTLVLSGNCLTEKALDALLNFTRINTTLRNVYFSRNNMNCLKGHTRTKINLLRESGINLYI